MIAVIGNSPSSGSTLLGDLLDSTPASICGPELNLFTNTRLYDEFSRFTRSPYTNTRSPAIYSFTNRINRHRLAGYGLDEHAFRVLLGQVNNASEFTSAFAQHFALYRGKPGAVWFEKTPQNIGVARQFLERFNDSYFIHIVRNPLYVANSLLNRGFPSGIALFAWLFEVAAVYEFESEKLVTLRYEDLVRNPWDTVSALLQKTSGLVIPADTIKQGYLDNHYRKEVSGKLATWEANQYGVVIDANRKQINPLITGRYRDAMNWKISDTWAGKYGLPAITYREAIRYFGYEYTLEDCTSASQNDQTAALSTADWIHLAKKQLKEALCLRSCPQLLINPVERGNTD